MDDLFWLIPISAIVGGITYVIVKVQAEARLRELEVRERIAMIEKGFIPPPEANPRGFEQAMEAVDQSAASADHPGQTRHHRGPERHRSAGITLIGIGLGLMLMLGIAAESPERGIGIGGFVAMIGLASLINGMVERRDRARQGRFGYPAPPPGPRFPPGHESRPPRS
jgi:Domain of unknown function (DUF6249)